MSIKTKLTIYFLIIFIIFSVVSSFSIYKNYYNDKTFSQEITKAIKSITLLSKQSTLAQLVRYDDEVLTQSARSYAFTGDKKWRDRYYEFVPKLDLRIKEAIDLGDITDKDIFNNIYASNLVLVKMEEEAIKLVDKNDLSSAQKILASDEYSSQKNIYKAGVDKYIYKYGLRIDEADPVSTKFLADSEAHFLTMAKTGTYLIFGLVFLFIGTVIFLFWIILSVFMKPLNVFKNTAKEIIKGNLEARVNISNKDEIGEFAADFNKMTQNLSDSIKNIEKEVNNKTKDLEKALVDSEKLNKLMVGRELEMIRLKKEIADLKEKIK